MLSILRLYRLAIVATLLPSPCISLSMRSISFALFKSSISSYPFKQLFSWYDLLAALSSPFEFIRFIDLFVYLYHHLLVGNNINDSYCLTKQQYECVSASPHILLYR